MTESLHSFDPDNWEPGPEDELLGPPAWRRRLLFWVAMVTVVGMASVPIYNVLQSRTVAANGLEVCGFDYCVVQEAMTEAGLDGTMSRLANTVLTEDEAYAFALDLTTYLQIQPVGLEVVPRLDGELGGFYDPTTRSITIERPASAWTVLHEVAHAESSGHGASFLVTVEKLIRWVQAAPSAYRAAGKLSA